MIFHFPAHTNSWKSLTFSAGRCSSDVSGSPLGHCGRFPSIVLLGPWRASLWWRDALFFHAHQNTRKVIQGHVPFCAQHRVMLPSVELHWLSSCCVKDVADAQKPYCICYQSQENLSSTCQHHVTFLHGWRRAILGSKQTLSAWDWVADVLSGCTVLSISFLSTCLGVHEALTLTQAHVLDC